MHDPHRHPGVGSHERPLAAPHPVSHLHQHALDLARDDAVGVRKASQRARRHAEEGRVRMALRRPDQGVHGVVEVGPPLVVAGGHRAKPLQRLPDGIGRLEPHARIRIVQRRVDRIELVRALQPPERTHRRASHHGRRVPRRRAQRLHPARA